MSNFSKTAKTLYDMVYLNDSHNRDIEFKMMIVSAKEPNLQMKHLNTIEGCFRVFEMADRQVKQLGVTNIVDLMQQFRNLGISGLGLHAVEFCLNVVNNLNPKLSNRAQVMEYDREFFRTYLEAQPELCVFVESVLGAVTVGEMLDVDHVDRVKEAYRDVELVTLLTDEYK